MGKLTAKQQRFCDEYLIDLNATQAAIRSGYSEKTARQIGTENLSKPAIKEYIENRLKEKHDELIADQDEVMRYLTSVMRREKMENIVVTVKKETSKYVPDEQGTMRKQTVKEEIPRVVQIPAQLRDSNKAAELLGRAFGTFSADVQVDVVMPVFGGEDSLED